MNPSRDINVAGLMDEMEEAATGIERASNRLYTLTQEFEGFSEDGGLGVRLTFESLVEDAATEIYDEYEAAAERPPPEVVRKARAVKLVKKDHPELYARYHKMKAELDALQRWLSSYRSAISARQSILSAEKEVLRGIPGGGPQPEWTTTGTNGPTGS
jgi:hypothetical protein